LDIILATEDEPLKPSYLNTDLEVRARFDFALLHRAFDRLGFAFSEPELLNGVWGNRYNAEIRHGHPAEASERMLDGIESLDSAERAMWDSCLARRFNIGVGFDDEEFGWTHAAWQVQPALLGRIAAVNASVVITVYRPDLLAAATDGLT